MRLARWQHTDGTIRTGRVEDDHAVPMTLPGKDTLDEVSLLLALATGGGSGAEEGEPVSLDEVKLLAPIHQPPTIRDFMAFEEHVATAYKAQGHEMPPLWYELPVFYFTNPNVVLDPGDTVAPPATAKLDYELEVAAVLGKGGRDLSEEEGAAAIAGFTILNDFSARDLQVREMELRLGPAKGKDFAQGLGPVLVTPDELGGDPAHPQGEMVARVNGREYSRGSLGSLHFGFGRLVAHASAAADVRPGDIIGSGTVGTGCILELSATHGSETYPWLVEGDEVELEVEGIGVLRHVIGRAPSA